MNRTLAPGVTRAGGVARRVPQDRVRASEQVPAARRGRRVHRRVLRGDGDGTCRHSGPGRRAAFERQGRVEPGQVREPGGEPAERARVGRRRVAGDDLLRGEGARRGDGGEVLAVVDDWDEHGRRRRSRLGRHRRQPGEDVADRAERTRVGDPDEHRSRSGDHLCHARVRERADRRGVPDHLVGVDLDEPAAGAVREQPGGHAVNGWTPTPAASRASRTALASPTAPGVSPCRHSEPRRDLHDRPVDRGHLVLGGQTHGAAPQPHPARRPGRPVRSGGRAARRAGTPDRRTPRRPAPDRRRRRRAAGTTPAHPGPRATGRTRRRRPPPPRPGPPRRSSRGTARHGA